MEAELDKLEIDKQLVIHCGHTGMSLTTPKIWGDLDDTDVTVSTPYLSTLAETLTELFDLAAGAIQTIIDEVTIEGNRVIDHIDEARDQLQS